MRLAQRQSDGEVINASLEKKGNGPFVCLDCGEQVVLKTGRWNEDHFAHVDPLRIQRHHGESELHRRCKEEIYEALLREPGAQNVALERDLGEVRPDVSAYIRGVPVAIEVQISSLTLESITERTIWYARKGIYVLWLLPWKSDLESVRYTLTQWEKWIHAAYFGRVYYWTQGLIIASYRYEPILKSVRRTSWFSKDGKKMTAGGFTRRSQRFRRPVRESTLNLAKDFGPKKRYWWEGNGIKVPDAKLYADFG